MHRVFKVLLLFTILNTSACMSHATNSHEKAQTEATSMQQFTGTIVFKRIEGGFFAFIANDNQRYTLRKLPVEYQLDGLVVTLTGSINTAMVTTTQFGQVLEVSSVEILDGSKAQKPTHSPKKLQHL